MANKKKESPSKEQILEAIDELDFEDQVALHDSLTSSIEAEASARVNSGKEAANVLDKINGKK